MNKELEYELTEEQEREVKLELVVHHMYEVFETLKENLPAYRSVQVAGDIFTDLYNLAEVRSDLEEYGTIELTFED